MGAYSNPEAYIDTQSGEHYRRMQENIVNATLGTMQSIRTQLEENKKKMDAIALKTGEEQSALNRSLSSVQQSNPSVDFETLYRPQIKKYAELRTRILSGTSTDPARDRMEADKIFNSVNSIKESLVDLGSEAIDFDEKFLKVGQANGIAYENDPNIIQALQIFKGNLPGKKIPKFIDEDPSKFVWEVQDDKGNKIAEFSAEQLKKTGQNGGLLKMVPDAAGSIDNAKKAATNVFDAKDGIPNGLIKEEFLGETIDKPLGNPSTKVVSGYEQKVTEFIPARVVDIDRIKADVNLKTILESKADGFINSSPSNSDAIIFHNTYFKNMPGFEPLDWNKPMSEEDKKAFVENYKEYVYNSLPKDQVIPGASKVTKSEVGKQVIQKPQKPTGGNGGSSKPTKVTKNESFIKELFDTPPSERGDKLMGKGTIISGPGKDANFIIDDSGNWRRAIKLEGIWVPDGPILPESAVKTRVGYKPSLTVKK